MPPVVVQQALKRLGIEPDSVLMVHSAFTQLSQDGYEPASILKAIVDYMYPGTLLMPTMSWRFVNALHPVFDERQTPSNTGILTELFRKQYATVRSCHPTHSVAGMGSLATKLLASHHLDDTPCSSRSPFGLHAQHNGWILMMGISIDCCTLVHAVEEAMAPEVYLKPVTQREEYLCRDRHGVERTVSLRRHQFLPRNYFQFQDELAREGTLRVTRIDNTICRAFKAGDLVRVVNERLKGLPDAIIAKPGDRYRMM